MENFIYEGKECRYWLVSCVRIGDEGRITFSDIQIKSENGSFFNRENLANDIGEDSETLVILSIYEFKSKEDFNNYETTSTKK